MVNTAHNFCQSLEPYSYGDLTHMQAFQRACLSVYLDNIKAMQRCEHIHLLPTPFESRHMQTTQLAIYVTESPPAPLEDYTQPLPGLRLPVYPSRKPAGDHNRVTGMLSCCRCMPLRNPASSVASWRSQPSYWHGFVRLQV